MATAQQRNALLDDSRWFNRVPLGEWSGQLDWVPDEVVKGPLYIWRSDLGLAYVKLKGTVFDDDVVVLSCKLPRPESAKHVLHSIFGGDDTTVPVALSELKLRPLDHTLRVSMLPKQMRSTLRNDERVFRRVEFVLLKADVNALLRNLMRPYVTIKDDAFVALFSKTFEQPPHVYYDSDTAFQKLRTFCRADVLPNVDTVVKVVTETFQSRLVFPALLTFIDAHALMLELAKCRNPKMAMRVALESRDEDAKNKFDTLVYFYSGRKDFARILREKYGLLTFYEDNFKTCFRTSFQAFLADVKSALAYFASPESFQEEFDNRAPSLDAIGESVVLQSRQASPVMAGVDVLTFSDPADPLYQVQAFVESGTDRLANTKVPGQFTVFVHDKHNDESVKIRGVGQFPIGWAYAPYRQDPRSYLDVHRGPKANYVAKGAFSTVEIWASGPAEARPVVLKRVSVTHQEPRSIQLSTFDDAGWLNSFGNKPAQLHWNVNADGTTKNAWQSYWLHGVLHRNDRAAAIMLDPRGKVLSGTFYYHGRHVDVLRPKLARAQKHGGRFLVYQNGQTCWAGSVLTLILSAAPLSSLLISYINNFVATIKGYANIIRGPLQVRDLPALVLQIAYRVLCTREGPTPEELSAATTLLEMAVTPDRPGYSTFTFLKQIFTDVFFLAPEKDFDLKILYFKKDFGTEGMVKTIELKRKNADGNDMTLVGALVRGGYKDGPGHMLAAVRYDDPANNFVFDPNGYEFKVDWTDTAANLYWYKRGFWKAWAREKYTTSFVVLLYLEDSVIAQSAGERVCRSHFLKTA